MGIIIFKNKNFEKHREFKDVLYTFYGRRYSNFGLKGEKVLLFGFSTGTKGEKLNCSHLNILSSPIVPRLSPLEIEEIFFYRSRYLKNGSKKI